MSRVDLNCKDLLSRTADSLTPLTHSLGLCLKLVKSHMKAFGWKMDVGHSGSSEVDRAL